MRRLHLPIQDPCHEDWTAMQSDGESRRFCVSCTKHVHDLSSMTERNARAVLADERAKGRVCVRYAMDVTGNIKFKTETVEAPSLWRTTLAAASVAMALLTGCTDSEPDQILADKCVYETGPFSFTAARGQGTCPAEDPVEEPMLVGELEAIYPEDPEPESEPVLVKGDIGPEPVVQPPPPPKPEDIGFMGALRGPIEESIEEPCDPEPKAQEAKPEPKLTVFMGPDPL